MLTVVHLVRHGEVHNPSGILYGRLPGFHLSELGRRMAARVAEAMRETPLTYLACSPMERTQETIEPIAQAHRDLSVVIDERLIEADNKFAGKVFNLKNKELWKPTSCRHFVNPLKPSWGEPYRQIADRMGAAITTARQAAGEGGQALLVSHQLPIWTARLAAEGRRLFHDPRRRQCSLASVTSLSFAGDVVVRVTYAEPAADLLPAKLRNKAFSVGS